jgi:hypothetical protein
MFRWLRCTLLIISVSASNGLSFGGDIAQGAVQDQGSSAAKKLVKTSWTIGKDSVMSRLTL